jgi:hypothetical protein
MNRTARNGGPPGLVQGDMKLPGVCWAGADPFGPGFCFGTEDGKLVFADEDGVPMYDMLKASHSGEAINGVAGIGQWIAVSTRHEVTTGSPFPTNERKHLVRVLPHGAHGIAAAPGGYLVAPLGRTGIMMLPADSKPDEPVGLLPPGRQDMYFYQVIALPGRKGKDLLVCACRRGGVGITESRWGAQTYHMGLATFPGLDVVDVCAVASKPAAPAVVALGRDGTLVFVRNAFRPENPVTRKFNTVKGTAYRVLSSGQHLFMLTSQALYALLKLGGQLVQGTPPGEFATQILTIHIDAADVNLVGGKWLVAVTGDSIRRFSVPSLVALAESKATERKGAEVSEALGETSTPEWERYEVSQASKELAAPA